MKQLKNFSRTKRLIEETISKLDLDLHGMNVLTEAASGNYVVTPIIAAISGAETVYVVSKDTAYGTVKEVMQHLCSFAEFCDIAPNCIRYTENKDLIAKNVNLVTNSGFVRPINDEFIRRLPEDAAISLMFESWEFRPEDIDVASCIRNNVPILGVNENDERLKIFRYVGLDVLKLLFEEQIEVFKGRFLLLSSGSYLKEIEFVLTANGAIVETINTESLKNTDPRQVAQGPYDAIIVAEQKNPQCLLNDDEGCLDLHQVSCDGPIIHIAGVIDDNYIKRQGFQKYPNKEIGYGYMTVTTEYMGVRPVIELNAAGLRVGQLLVEGMRKYYDIKKAQDYALQDSCAMAFDMIRSN